MLFSEVSKALEAVEHIQQAANELKNGRQGHLSVAAYASISINLLPKLIASFMEQRPGLKIKLVTRSSHLVPELISTQQFDLVFAETPADYPSARNETFSYLCKCVLPPGSSLAAKKVITPADLDGHPFVALVRNAPIHQQVAWAFAQYGAVWNVVAETEYYVSACEMVKAGIGVSLVDPVISAPFFEGLECRPFKPDVRYDIAMLYNAKGPNSKLLLGDRITSGRIFRRETRLSQIRSGLISSGSSFPFARSVVPARTLSCQSVDPRSREFTVCPLASVCGHLVRSSRRNSTRHCSDARPLAKRFHETKPDNGYLQHRPVLRCVNWSMQEAKNPKRQLTVIPYPIHITPRC